MIPAQTGPSVCATEVWQINLTCLFNYSPPNASNSRKHICSSHVQLHAMVCQLVLAILVHRKGDSIEAINPVTRRLASSLT